MSISVEVWGDYALFSRPEMKTERVSYDVMTPSAARGLLESVFWHPGLKWVVDRIHVCAPIRFTNIRRNEVNRVGGADSLSPRPLTPPCVPFGTRRFPSLRCYFKVIVEKKRISGFLQSFF